MMPSLVDALPFLYSADCVFYCSVSMAGNKYSSFAINPMHNKGPGRKPKNLFLASPTGRRNLKGSVYAIIPPTFSS